MTNLMTFPIRCLLFTAGIMFLAGCQWGNHSTGRVPEVETRFTANPLLMTSESAVITSTAPQIRVGLAMQSSTDSAAISFASRLGTVLIRELQLSSGGFRVTPMAALDLRTAVPALETNESPDVVTVSLQEPVETLPPHLPPSPFYDSTTPILVDQIIVIRILEYRAYYPMLVTLDLRVLNGESQNEMFATTATWSGDDYLLTADCSDTKKHWWNCREPQCQPAPGHNSPQALMHEIAKDVTGWYVMSTNSGMTGLIVADSTTSGTTTSGVTSSAVSPDAAASPGITQVSHVASPALSTESKRVNSASTGKLKGSTSSSAGKKSLSSRLPRFPLFSESEKSKEAGESSKSD